MQFSLLLIASSAIVRLASSLYLPSLIDIGRTLHLSDSIMSTTLSVFFVAFAFATLFAGPLADRYGRKNVIIGGGVIFIVGTLLCALASSATALFSGRILQAIGASCIPVAGRAMIRDMCSDTQVIKVLGWMAAIGGIVPIAAPMLGGIINDAIGWRYNFWFLQVFTLIAGAILILKLPRSMKKEDAHPLHIMTILKTYGRMLAAPEFITIILPLMLSFAIQGAYLGTSPFIFMERFGLSGTQYGMANIVIVASLLAGRYLATGLTRRFSTYAAYMVGAAMPLIGGVIMAMIIRMNLASITSVLIALSVAVTGFGTILPIGVKSIMTAFRDRAGAVSALYGCMTLGMSSVGCFAATVIEKQLRISELTSLALFTCVAGMAILASAVLTKKHLR